uniref:Uncharacterized protein n=1 Tax=Caenorhabditis japonica TaxID=281687 RepID=A0A8R1ID46_CAEJA
MPQENVKEAEKEKTMRTRRGTADTELSAIQNSLDVDDAPYRARLYQLFGLIEKEFDSLYSENCACWFLKKIMETTKNNETTMEGFGKEHEAMETIEREEVVQSGGSVGDKLSTTIGWAEWTELEMQADAWKEENAIIKQELQRLEEEKKTAQEIVDKLKKALKEEKKVAEAMKKNLQSVQGQLIEARRTTETVEAMLEERDRRQMPRR